MNRNAKIQHTDPLYDTVKRLPGGGCVYMVVDVCTWYWTCVHGTGRVYMVVYMCTWYWYMVLAVCTRERNLTSVPSVVLTV